MGKRAAGETLRDLCRRELSRFYDWAAEKGRAVEAKSLPATMDGAFLLQVPGGAWAQRWPRRFLRLPPLKVGQLQAGARPPQRLRAGSRRAVQEGAGGREGPSAPRGHAGHGRVDDGESSPPPSSASSPRLARSMTPWCLAGRLAPGPRRWPRRGWPGPRQQAAAGSLPTRKRPSPRASRWPATRGTSRPPPRPQTTASRT